MTASADQQNVNDYPFSSEGMGLKEYLLLMRRGRWIILISTAIIFLGVAFYTFTSKPVYEASVRILVEDRGKEGTRNFLDLLAVNGSNKIMNELEILRSNALAEAVARALTTKMFVDKPSGKRLAILEERKDEQVVITSQRNISERLAKSVDFVPIKESDVIKMTVRSNDPEEAALIANTYAGVYSQRNLDMSRSRSRVVREFLQSQLDEKQKSLQTSESALQSYMRNSGVVTLDGEVKKVVEQLSQLEATRDALGVEISSRNKTLESMQQELVKQEPNAAKSIAQSNDAYVRLLQEQIAQLEVQRDVLIAQNPDMVGQKIFSQKLGEIGAQIETLRKNLQNRTKEYLDSMLPGEMMKGAREGGAGFLAGLKQKVIEQQIELDGLNARREQLNKVIAEYEVQFSRIPQKSIDLAKYQRSRLSSEKLYLLVEEKYNEAAITETSQLGYVNIVDPAIVPEQPVSPRVMLNLLLGFIIGLGCGIAIVIVRSTLNVAIHTPEDLKRSGHIPLGVVGNINSIKQAAQSSKRYGQHRLQFDGHLITAITPFSTITESYRHLRTSIEYAELDKPIRRILVTSPLPGEGKSTTAANLAIVCAGPEKRVLLIDADMRRPVMHSLFGLKNEVGLAHVITGQRSLDEALVTDVIPHLDVLLSGALPPNPAEILGSKRMTDLLDKLSSKYDLLILDTPPVLGVTDPAVLSRHVDGVILVLKTGFSRLDILERATEVMVRVGSKLLGVVLNKFDPQKSYGRYYSRYAYGYGYAEYTSSQNYVSTGGNGQAKGNWKDA